MRAGWPAQRRAPPQAQAGGAPANAQADGAPSRAQAGAAPPKPAPHRALRTAAGVGVAAVCLAAAWRLAGDIDLHSLQALRPGPLVLALAAFAAGYACRIRRWQRLLAPINPRLRWRDCAGPLLAGVALNNLLPLRAGDLLRATAYRHRLGVPAAAAVASLVAERALDLAALLAIAGVASAAMARPDGAARAAWLLPALAALAVLIGLGLAAWLATRWGLWREARPPSPGMRRRWPAPPPAGERSRAQALLQPLRQAATALRTMLPPGALRPLAGWTAAAWLCEGAVFGFTALAMPALPAPAGAALAWPLATLATLVPGSPGHVGTFDLAAQQAMAWAGNPPAQALAYALLVHAVLWLPATLAGAACLALQAASGPGRGR